MFPISVSSPFLNLFLSVNINPFIYAGFTVPGKDSMNHSSPFLIILNCDRETYIYILKMQILPYPGLMRTISIF